MSNQIIN